MPLLGAHESISGGVHNAIYRADEKGFEVIQIFTRNRLKWHGKKLTDEEIAQFRKARKETGVIPVSIHGSYLLNPASPDKKNREKSIRLCLREMTWARELEIPYMVIHPGFHKGAGVKRGLEIFARSLKEIFNNPESEGVDILLETTSGQGTSLGSRFEHIKTIMDLTGCHNRLGVCFDTCHVFAAGYDYRSKQGYGQTMKKFDNVIGVEKIKIFHINDSKAGTGSFIDRHAHPGRGAIGLKGLGFFLRDGRFKGHPFLLETPKGLNESGIEMDIINLDILRKLTGRKH